MILFIFPAIACSYELSSRKPTSWSGPPELSLSVDIFFIIVLLPIIITRLNVIYKNTTMKPGLMTLLLSLLLYQSHGQAVFEKKFSPSNKQYGREIHETADHGFFLQGTIEQGYRNCYLVRTDSLGDTLWTKTYGTDSIQYYAYDMVSLPDGGYLVCGDYQEVSTSPSMDSYVQKLDSNGNEVWFNLFGWPTALGGNKDHAQLVKTLTDGSVIVEGSTKDFYISVGNYQALGIGWRSYLAKFDSSGLLQDIVTVGLKIDTMWGPDYSAFHMETIGNKIYWLGINSYAHYPNTGKTILAVFDSALDTLFTIDSGLNSYYGLGGTGDDHLLLFGNGITAKMDTLGNFLWTMPNASPSMPYAMVETGNGEFISVGGTDYISPFGADFYGAGNPPVYLNRYSSSGSLSASAVINVPPGITMQLGFDVTATVDNGFAFTGFSDQAIWLVKTDSTGNFSSGLADFGLPDERIRLFPNPASTSCEISSEENPVSLDVYSLTGTRVFTTLLQDKSYTLTLNDFSEGFYLLSLTDRAGKISRRKLLVAR